MTKGEEHDYDNGIVVCDMNVEGTRWYKKDAKDSRSPNAFKQQMTRSEARRYTFYSILAGLSVVFVFSATWILFTLFCTQVWFK